MASGKTWAADYLKNLHGYSRESFAAKLKAIAYEMYGITGKDGNDRIILQELGTDLRKHDKDVWIKYLLSNIKFKEEQSKYFKPVIDDVRYVNEANILRRNGFIIIRVVTDEKLLSGRIARLYPNRPAQAALHPSETEHMTIKEDYTFYNDELLATLNLDNLMADINGN